MHSYPARKEPPRRWAWGWVSAAPVAWNGPAAPNSTNWPRAPVWIGPFFGVYKWQTVAITVSLFATAELGTLPPLCTPSTVNDGSCGRHFGVIVHLTIAVLAVAIVSGLLSVLQSHLSGVIGQRVTADFHYRMSAHLHRESQRFFVETESGELVSRVSNDVGAIQTVATSTNMSVVSHILTIGTPLTVID